MKKGVVVATPLSMQSKYVSVVAESGEKRGTAKVCLDSGRIGTGKRVSSESVSR